MTVANFIVTLGTFVTDICISNTMKRSFKFLVFHVPGEIHRQGKKRIVSLLSGQNRSVMMSKIYSYRLLFWRFCHAMRNLVRWNVLGNVPSFWNKPYTPGLYHGLPGWYILGYRVISSRIFICELFPLHSIQPLLHYSSCITNSSSSKSSSSCIRESFVASSWSLLFSWLLLPLVFELDLAWVSMCDLRLVDCAKRLLHESKGHTYGLSPVCIRTCVRKLKSKLKRLPQPSNVH